MSRILLTIGKAGCQGENKDAKAFGGYAPVLINNVMIKTTAFIKHIAHQTQQLVRTQLVRLNKSWFSLTSGFLT